MEILLALFDIGVYCFIWKYIKENSYEAKS